MIDDFLTRTATGLVLDRTSDPTTVSVAATGFAMDCWAIESTKGNLSRDEAISRINQAIDSTIQATPIKNQGWLYHFTDEKGNPKFTQEVSSIDSAIFYASARQASYRVNDKLTIDKVETLISKVNISWMMKDGYFRHGLYWGGDSPQFIPVEWQEYSEGIILYRLFDVPYAPSMVDYDLPLFVFYYPLCFFNDEELKVHLHNVIARQKSKGCLGKTVCDSETGYGYNEDVISPVALWAINKEDGEPPIAAKNVKTGWKSTDKVAIDYASAFILRYA